MTVKTDTVQYSNVAIAEIEVPTTGLTLDLCELPAGAIVIGGEITVTTVSGGTTPTISIGDAGLATRYASAVGAAALARTALTLTGFKTSGASVVRLSVGGTPDGAGRARIAVMYVRVGRANEVRG